MTLTSAAHCLRCDWTDAGDPAAVDRASAKHTKDTGHPTGVMETPEAGK